MTTSDNNARATDNSLDLKLLAIGDSGVGKTCLLSKYVDGEFIQGLGTTVGIDIRNKTIQWKSAKTNRSYTIHLQLWDTAGQERYRSLTTSFFRDAMGFLLVFDLTNESSFLNVRNWIGEIQANAYSDEISTILVGNKCDLESERIISKHRALELAQQHQIEYIETSALNNTNVQESVQLLLTSVINSYEENENLTKKTIHMTKLPTNVFEAAEFTKQTKPNKSMTYCCNY